MQVLERDKVAISLEDGTLVNNEKDKVRRQETGEEREGTTFERGGAYDMVCGLFLFHRSVLLDKDIDCRQFVEILIRIAHSRTPSLKERSDILSELRRDEAEQKERVERGGLSVPEQHSIDALTRASISFGMRRDRSIH